MPTRVSDRLGERVAIGPWDIKSGVGKQLGDGFAFIVLRVWFIYMKVAVMGLEKVISKSVHLFCTGRSFEEKTCLVELVYPNAGRFS